MNDGKQTAFNKDSPDAALWMGTHGPLSNYCSIVRVLNKYAYQAKLNFSSHTFATRYLAASPDDVHGLATLLGHTNLSTGMIYTEPRLDDLMERMERAETNN